MTQRSTDCPSCAQAGVAVDRVTLKALLTADGLRRGIPAQPRYCANARCAVVYFDVDGDATFTEREVSVKVYAKQAGDPATTVCYCFGISVGAMSGDGARELREGVAREVQAQHCACEVKNPKGGCCLGDLVRLERGPEVEEAASCCST